MGDSLETLLVPQRVLCSVQCASKKRLLEITAGLVVQGCLELDENLLCESFNARERLGSTGIGEGIAIPHCRLPGCRQAIAALITLATPVEFAAIDDAPVDIVFALVVPDEAEDAHLQTLARLAGLFDDAALRSRLRACEDAGTLYQTLLQAWNRGAGAP